MIELIVTLVPIALIDSLSVVPLTIVPMALLLGGRRPVTGALAFIAGIVLTYLPFGVLLLFGLDALFDGLAARFSEWWSSEPDLGEVVLEIVVGLAMVIFGHGLCRRGSKRKSGESRSGMTPVQAFTLAAVINVSGFWGALPYFAAIAQILKADLSTGGILGAILLYNLVFALPLFSFLLLHLLLGEQAQRWFANAADFTTRWGGRVVTILLIGLGFVLIIDGIAWLYGVPLVMGGARD